MNTIDFINSAILAKNVVLTVLDYCALLFLLLVAHYIAEFLLIVALVVASNLIAIKSAIHILREIHENY